MQNDIPLIPANVSQEQINARTQRGRWQMFLVLLVCAAPVIASYVTFYLIKPTGGQTNYGQLVYPVQEAPEVLLKPEFYGKWTLLMARPAANCEQEEKDCAQLLYLMRQIRTSLGKEKGRLQIIWLNLDSAVVSQKLLEAYDPEVAGVRIIVLPSGKEERARVEEWLNLDNAKNAIQLIDPQGNRMMRFVTENNELDFKKMRKDIEKLLKWNPTGKYRQ